MGELSKLNDAQLAVITQQRSLRRLEVGNSVTPDGVALHDQPHLRELIFSFSSDALLPSAEAIVSLRAMRLGSGFTAEAIKRLQSTRPDLVIFHTSVPATDAERDAVDLLFQKEATRRFAGHRVDERSTRPVRQRPRVIGTS